MHLYEGCFGVREREMTTYTFSSVAGTTIAFNPTDVLSFSSAMPTPCPSSKVVPISSCCWLASRCALLISA